MAKGGGSQLSQLKSKLHSSGVTDRRQLSKKSRSRKGGQDEKDVAAARLNKISSIVSGLNPFDQKKRCSSVSPPKSSEGRPREPPSTSTTTDDVLTHYGQSLSGLDDLADIRLPEDDDEEGKCFPFNEKLGATVALGLPHDDLLLAIQTIRSQNTKAR
ncbi:hypothetical protein L1887_47111 [Cichorium endivia]|nr:hypothetical protein L1887_47111 [Cichorium endivia]